MSLPRPIIAVLAGGTSAEREVSLGSGRASALALARSFPTRLFEVDAEANDGDLVAQLAAATMIPISIRTWIYALY